MTHSFLFLLSHGLKTVINLQRPGEHASCGNPLEQESGFTYLPEAFMEAGSKSFHPSLQDSTQRLWSAQLLALKGDGNNCAVVGLLNMKMSSL